MNRRILLVATLITLLVVGGSFIATRTLFAPTTITANFTSATGLYVGDDVRIAGVKVGSIRGITPRSDRAEILIAVDHGVKVPADARAVIVAQNLVAARYIQLAPMYVAGQEVMGDHAVIPIERTAVPVEWDEVKAQLMNLASSLGPDAELSSSSVGRFIDSAANAMNGNGDKLRQTFAQLSTLAGMLADNSGNIVDTVQNLQTFVTALRDSGEVMVQFQDRLASFSTVLNDSRSDLDSASRQISIAVGEVQRFVAGSHAQASEQVQRLANVTQVLVDHRSDIENILHVAPTAFANAYNIFNPNLPGALGSFVLNNFADPISFICSAIGGLQNVTASETGKLCANYLGPALRLMTFNYLPIPQNPLLAPVITPDKLVYPDPNLIPGGSGGAAVPPETLPAVSAYTGDLPAIPLPTTAPPPETRDDLLLPAEVPLPDDEKPVP